MNDNTQPEALRLAEILEGDYCPDWFYEQGVDEVAAELRRQHTRIAELQSELEAVGAGGVQALSAAPAVPAGWKAVPVNPTPEMWKAVKTVPDPNPPYPPHYGLVWDAMLAASPTPPAEQQAAPKAAPEVGNSGFDYKTAADFLNGKTVSDEAVRKFVAASRWAHDERAALSATLLAMHGVLTSREAEIALLKKALLEAEAAHQQEAQEPVVAAVFDEQLGRPMIVEGAPMLSHGQPLYTAPQPAPAPLSEQDPLQGAANWLAQAHGQFCVSVLQGCLMIGHNRAKRLHDAALAAQGGKDA